MASAEVHVHVSLDKPIAEYVEQVREALRGDVEALRAAGWVPLAEVLAALREMDPVEAALAGQHAYEDAAQTLAERFQPTADTA